MITALSIADLPADDRPLCHVCGHRPMSMGKDWACGECGKSFVKNLRNPPVDFSARPKCPKCGGQRTIKHDYYRMKCQICGRTFKR